MSHQRNDALNWNELSIEDILELAIADEEEAQEYYRHAASCVGNIHTRRMLLKLSEMEQTHAAQLRQELAELHLQREEETGIAD
jgi:rubrerythrin